MSIEYLGNKRRLLDFVIGPIMDARVSSVADLFCGTASVSGRLASSGVRIVANDHLALCSTLAEADLLMPEAPRFEALRGEVRFTGGRSNYESVIESLNSRPPEAGYFTNVYSPDSRSSGTERMYLTVENAMRADAIRAAIAEWEPVLSQGERAVLLRDLVVAVARVSNTAGTFGCYLKHWKARALDPLELVPATEWSGVADIDHEIHCADAASLLPGLDVDAVYLDPPYTKRQYAAYYHLLDTMIKNDEPEVTGSTGLPDWQKNSSDFCYRKRAPEALSSMVNDVSAPHIFLSYSDDGHIKHDEIVDILKARGGVVKWWEKASSRYRSNRLVQSSDGVFERLYHLALS